MAVVVGDIRWFGHHHAGVFTPVGGAFEPAEATSRPIFPVWTANSLKVGVHWCFIVVVGNGFRLGKPLQPCLTREEKLTDGLHWMFVLCHWIRRTWNEKGGYAYIWPRATPVLIVNFTTSRVKFAACSEWCVIRASIEVVSTVIRTPHVFWTSDYFYFFSLSQINLLMLMEVTVAKT